MAWLSTNDSEANVKRGRGVGAGSGALQWATKTFRLPYPRRKVLPNLVQVFNLVAKNDLVLETGHSSPSESLILIPEATLQGSEKDHGHSRIGEPGGSMTIEGAQQATKMGAYIELVYDATLQQSVGAIAAASCVLSRNLDRRGRPVHPDGFLMLYQTLVKRGITVAEIRWPKPTPPSCWACSLDSIFIRRTDADAAY
jgi:hypothetical protein